MRLPFNLCFGRKKHGRKTLLRPFSEPIGASPTLLVLEDVKRRLNIQGRIPNAHDMERSR